MKGGTMKTELNVEELQKRMPSKREAMYLQRSGLLVFLAAFFFCRENFIHPVLLMIGVTALTRGFEKSNLRNKHQQIRE